MMNVFVGPGDIVPFEGDSSNLVCGYGCYYDGNIIRATQYGYVFVETTTISIKPQKKEEQIINTIGSIVTCRVQKIYTNQVVVEITHIGDELLKLRPKGIIKREDISTHTTNSIPIYEFFRPGDMVRAEVVSLGDSKQFYLRTSDVSLGVVKAASRSGGMSMISINAQVQLFNLSTLSLHIYIYIHYSLFLMVSFFISMQEMMDPITKLREKRKVALITS